MKWGSSSLESKRFRYRWRGFDPHQVESYLSELTSELQRLRIENARQKEQLKQLEKELQEYRERDKVIKDVLVNAQKASEQIKTNAEKEAKLIIAEAELQAEKMLQGAHQRLSQLHDDINELKRQRTQLETKLRATIETYRQLLDMEKEEADSEELDTKIKFITPKV